MKLHPESLGVQMSLKVQGDFLQQQLYSGVNWEFASAKELAFEADVWCLAVAGDGHGEVSKQSLTKWRSLAHSYFASSGPQLCL